MLKKLLPFHLMNIDGSIAIHIIHSKSPGQLFLRCPIRRDMKCEHELPEIYGSASVRVKSSEHIFTKFVSIAAWKDLDIHFDKLSLCQLPIRTILQESFVPFLDIWLYSCYDGWVTFISFLL